MLVDRTVKDFIEMLSSAKPTPGGGSVAALGGALGAALVSMVCRIGDEAEELAGILNDSEILRAECTKLVDEDAAAFDMVMAAYRLPKRTDEEKATRSEAVQKALVEAARVPLIVAGRCAEVVRLAGEAVRRCSSDAVSDVGVAALIAHASLKGAAYNVRINLRTITDDEFKEECLSELEFLAEEAGKNAREVEKFAGSAMR